MKFFTKPSLAIFGIFDIRLSIPLRRTNPCSRRDDSTRTMLGDTAVAVHPDPDRALQVAETNLRERLNAAPAKEKPALEKQLEELWSDARIFFLS